MNQQKENTIVWYFQSPLSLYFQICPNFNENCITNLNIQNPVKSTL